MGNRSQVAIKYNSSKTSKVYLYSHWGGKSIYRDIARALNRAPDRWDDDEYLARVIFSIMIEDDVKGTTGYGIGVSMHGDIEHPIPVLNCQDKMITWEEAPYQNEETPEAISFTTFAKRYG